MSYEFDGLDASLRPYAEALYAAANEAGLSPRVTSVLRSYASQKRLWDQYQAGYSRYPAAPPGFSSHEQGWAFDLAVNDDSYLPDLGALWESWGGTWGGRFRDPIHFELGGASAYLRQLRESGSPSPNPPGYSPAESAAVSGTGVYESLGAPYGSVLLNAAHAGQKIIDWIF